MITRTTKWLGLISLVLATALLLPQFALAQGDRDDNGDDPPSRAARLSYTSGAVSFEPAGTDDWVSIVANRPITTGDKLWTDKGGRAELRFGSSAVRIGGETGFSFLNLDDRTAQIRLTEGTVNVRVKRLDEEESIEIDTPNLAFTVLRPGSYRVSVNEAGDTTVVTVRGGDGEVTGAGAAYSVHADQTGTFYGNDQLSADIQNYGNDDDFDRWCSDRDRRWDHSTSARYVSDDVVGYEDLDEYGGWRPVPEYGTVWFPHTTVVGWAPYRYGHWAWVSPWGWTWVDDAPWGFAPFHYGRWVTVGGVWGWVPCPPRPRVVTVAYVRPVYAPALVAWVGGAHWGVGVSVGGPPAVGVAWFPLGPRDVYCPSYHVSPRYVERVNVSNTINRTQVTNVYNNVYVNKTVNVTNITYQNQHINNSVTATSQATFTSAQSVHNNIIRVNERDISAAPVAPTGPAVVPQQRSVLGAGAEARVRPSERFNNRQVVARTAPPPAPVSFARQQQAIQANGGRPVAIAQEREMQTQTARPNVRIAPPARQVTPQNQRNVVNRPNQPNQVQPNPVQPNQGNPPNQNATVNRPNQPNQTNPPNQVNQQNRPVQTNQPPANPNRPTTVTNDNIQNGGRDNGNPRGRNDRPPAARQPEDPRLEQKHQQELENLRQQQDRERQKVEQQQVQQQQKIQQQNNTRNQQQIQERQQKQLEQMEQRHDVQQQKLDQKQKKEEQKAKPESKPPKPPKDKEPKNNDRPQH
ncbi:MAG TPA: DUF6600 domain-containing protein [Candidatus Sulfotelmatobacter sp.]|jgi:hypothetical protein|nr:DUF6600 domain-containing protein [Candidatus Sulfotelmatobacter sp.]